MKTAKKLIKIDYKRYIQPMEQIFVTKNNITIAILKPINK